MPTILGLDPGLAETGYGVITVSGGRYLHRCHGIIRTEAGDLLGLRLSAIYDEVMRLTRDYRVDAAAVETLFFQRNATSAIPVAQARGVVILALTQAGIEAADYTPQAIKQAIVGHGRAEKAQVQHLVRILLGLVESPEPDHAADALAGAICHAQHLAVFSGPGLERRSEAFGVK